MHITPQTTVHEILTNYPFLLDILAERAPVFAKLKNPVLRASIGRVATLEKAASLGGMPCLELQLFVAGEILRRTGDAVTLEVPAEGAGGTEPPAESARAAEKTLTDGRRMQVLKELVLALHDGASIEGLKQRFQMAVGDISGAEIAALEQTLVKEGLPESEIKRLCALHVDLFRSSLERAARPDMPAGHPVNTYMAENAKAVELCEALRGLIHQASPNDRVDPLLWSFNRAGIRDTLEALADIELHYRRKENQLFPLLEARGAEAPAKVMWEVHDDIRKSLKSLRQQLAGPFDESRARREAEDLTALLQEIEDMAYKEERVMFPMALELLDDADWSRAKKGEDEIGYAWVTPGSGWIPEAGNEETGESDAQGLIQLDTGRLSRETLNEILRKLPVDLSFVDPNDRVAYYSDSPHRIFPRSAAVIGREVRNCHPPKSVHMVEAILKAFKAGERDTAEFWLELGGRFIHIRYYAVHNAQKRYLGCLEVSQDVTGIRALQGQRRLLDWA